MRTTVAAAVAALALGLAGCSDSGRPSPPPTPDQPTTTSSPADTSRTTEGAPTTEAPSETDSTNLPPEATEDSEAGAEAFALHYISLINQTAQEPQPGLLEELGADGCESCANFEGAVAYLAENDYHATGPGLEVVEATTETLGGGVSVLVTVNQLEHDVVDNAGSVQHLNEEINNVTFKFDLVRVAGNWLVEEVFVSRR